MAAIIGSSIWLYMDTDSAEKPVEFHL